MKAMILAAGLGTRLRPFTNNHPKALAPVNGKTVLERNIQYLLQYGISEIVINVHHHAMQITRLLKENAGFGASITISDETDLLLETGGALKKVAPFFIGEESFVMMNADILSDMPLDQLIARHLNSGALATLAVSDRPTSRFLIFTPDGLLAGWENTSTGAGRIVREAPEYQRKAFSGIQVMSPEILKLMLPQDKFSIIDVYMKVAPHHDIDFYDHSGCRFIDVGKPESLEAAGRMFA